MTKKIIFQPGPAHLFRSLGIGYLKKIESHEVFILIDESYNNNDLIEIEKNQKKIHIFKYESKNSFKNHLKINKILKYITENNKIDIYLIHNQIFIDNLYVIYYWKKNQDNSNMYTFQNGRQTLNFSNDRRDALAFQTNNIFFNIKFLNDILSKEVKLNIIKIRNIVSSFVNYNLIPFLILGTIFRPVINNLTGRIDDEKGINHKRYRHLMYLEVEKAVALKFGIKNIKLIKNPMLSYIKDNQVAINNINILIAPSYGYIENLISKNSQKKLIISTILDRWANIIKICKDSLGSNTNLNFVYKSHPAYTNDPIVEGISERFKEEEKTKLIIMHKDSNISELLSMSNIVIGDGSSVLWLAGILNKNTVCVDLFGYDNINEFKNYEPLIKYADTFESFKKIIKHFINKI